MYRLSRELRIEDGNIGAWLERMPLTELLAQLAFMEMEPLSEDRADMRIGALASVLVNCNIDTSKHGSVTPINYVTGWGKDNVYILAYHKKEPVPVEELNGSDSDRTLNNPTVWNEFITTVRSLNKQDGY